MQPYFAIDWSHDQKTKQQNLRTLDVATGKITKTLPEPKDGLVVVTENMPLKECKKFLDAGGRVFRCSGVLTAKYRQARGIEKSHDNDVKVISVLFKQQPNDFYEVIWDIARSELDGLVKAFSEMQDVRVAMGNRSWANEDSKALEEITEEFRKQEKSILKRIETSLADFPVYTEYLSKIKGIGPTVSAQLISYYGDPARFKTVAQMWSYFGLGVFDGEAQRKRKGQVANWHQNGRALIIGVIGSIFVKSVPRIKTKGGQPVLNDTTGLPETTDQNPWRLCYESFKAKEASKVDAEGKPIKPVIANKRAIRKMMKEFMRRFYYAQNRYNKTAQDPKLGVIQTNRTLSVLQNNEACPVMACL